MSAFSYVDYKWGENASWLSEHSVTETLAGRVAVVTGASRGIGRAIAVALAEAGADLCLVARDRSALDNLAFQLQEGRVIVRTADLARPGAASDLAEALLCELRSVDVLVHAAGVCAFGNIEETPAAQLDQLFAVNVRAPYELTRSLLPALKSRAGQVVLMSSSAGVVARAGFGPYAVTKHAVKALADTLREEANSDGVRVLTVFPGRTATTMQAVLHQQEKKPYHPEQLLQPEDVAAVVMCALTLPRTAEITDVHMRPMAKPQP